MFVSEYAAGEAKPAGFDLKQENLWLMHGDCLERMKEIPSGSVDMVLCDLPYGTIACKWDVIIPFDKLWAEYRRVAKQDAAIVLTSCQPFTTALIHSNIAEFKYTWVWHKNTTSGFVMAKKQPLRNHEDVTVFYRKQPTYNPEFELRDLNAASKKRFEYDFTSTKGENVLQGGLPKVEFIPISKTHRYPTTVKKFNSVPTASGRLHPTQKPLELMEYMVKTYTNEGETVLDNCMGSGTTGVACANLNRKFIGIEMDEGYFNIAKERILKSKETN